MPLNIKTNNSVRHESIATIEKYLEQLHIAILNSYLAFAILDSTEYRNDLSKPGSVFV